MPHDHRPEQPSGAVPPTDGARSDDGSDARSDDWSDGWSDRGSAAPRWLWTVVLLGTATLVTIGSIGTALAMFGWYRTWLVVVLATPVVVAVAAAARRSPGLVPDSPPTHRQHAWAIAAALIFGVLAAWSASQPGHTVFAYNDPGVYSSTAVWIAEHGSLRTPIGGDTDGPFIAAVTDRFAAATFTSSGVDLAGDGEIEYQFAHAPSVVYAIAYDLAGDRGLFALPAAAGYLAMLATYLLATRFVRTPPLALAATFALAVSIPFLFVTRGTYSEPLALAAASTGVAVLVSSERLRPITAAAAGACIGASLLFRIDGQLTVVALIATAVVVALGPTPRRSFAIGGLAAAVPATIGVVDMVVFSNRYWRAHDDFVLAVIVVAVVGIAAVWVVVRSRDGTARAWLDALRTRWLPAAALPAAIGVAALLAFGWLLRPRVSTGRRWVEGTELHGRIEQLQLARGIEPDGAQTYAELGLSSIGWNLGVPTLALAIGGIALMTHRALRAPAGPTARYLVFVIVGAAAYLIDWRITPYQPWASRRFVPVVLPLFAIAAAVAAEAVVRRVAAMTRDPARRRTVARPATAVLAAAIALSAAIATWPVRDLAEQRGFASGLDDACDAIGDDPVVVLGPRLFPGTIRIRCGVPTVLIGEFDDDTIGGIAEISRSTCQPASLVANWPGFWPEYTWDGYAEPTVIDARNEVFPEQSIEHAPMDYELQRLVYSVIPVDLPSTC